MKIHIVTSANRAAYVSEIEQMHRLRHEVFVGELGWTDLASADGLEVDAFDEEEAAVYLIACENAEVFGSVRLLPTWRRSMLKELWPHFASERAIPIGPGIWEWTRWCPGTIRRPRQLIKARGLLAVAALEFARSRAITKYFTFCDVKFVGQLEEAGWRPRPLGLPQDIAGTLAVAVDWDITSALLAHTRRVFHVSGPASLEAPAADGIVPEAVQPWILERLLGARQDESVAVAALAKTMGIKRSASLSDAFPNGAA